MNTLVCVKRVPESSGEVALTADGMHIDGRHAGWTTSAHEECAVEIAAQVAASGDGGGTVTVLTLGGEDSVEQLRAALAVGATDGVRIEADADEFGPADVAAAIAEVVQAREAAGTTYDLVLLGNDAADTGDFQVGIRLSYLLGRPVVAGAQTIEVDGSVATISADTEVYEVALPAVATILEGGVSPKYPSITGKIKAKKAPIETVTSGVQPKGNGRQSLRVPPPPPSQVEVLGEGPTAAGRLAQVLSELGVGR